MTYNGIDISNHNGKVNWSKVVETIDFVMIRAGYGRNNIDARLVNNVKGCQSYSIDFGFYWFSYALDTADAKNEADYVCNLADKYHPTYPIAYDWEYDSDEYAKKCGVTISNQKREEFAKTFLNRVKERGYTPILYTNIDYLSKGFNNLTTSYDIWLAQWGVNKPTRSCKIWQKTSSGKVNGISGSVDLNVGYKNYADKTNSNTNTSTNDNKETKTDKKTELEKVKNTYWNTYLAIAEDVIKGKYGNGNDRKKKLKNLGYDYDLVQSIVNILVKK